MKRYVLATVMLAAAFQLRALNPISQQWVQPFHGLGNGEDAPNGVAVDPHGNVFVVGYAITTNGYPDYDFVTLKYSPSGVPLWTNYYDGPAHGWDHAFGLALDRAGNVFITGISQAGAYGYNYATIAYSNNGVPLWTNRYNGLTNANDQAEGIAVDKSSGAVYVSGFEMNDVLQYVTIKYSNAGVPLWTNALTAAPSMLPDPRIFLAVGKNGSTFVTGTAVNQTSGEDYVTVAYSSAGAPLWTNYYNGPGNQYDNAAGIAVDKHDNVFVTGASYGSDTNWDFATIAYSAAGTPLWTNRFDGPAHSDDLAKAIAVNDRGDVFVTGDTVLTTNTDDFSSYATIAYSGAGIPLWTNFYAPTTNDDEPLAIATEFNRGVFVTGFSVANDTAEDYATIEYSRNGEPISTNRYNGPANDTDIADAIAVGQHGDVLVTGYSNGTNGGPDIVTIKYSPTRPR